MQKETVYGAPWGTSLKVLTCFSVLVLLGIAFMGTTQGPTNEIGWRISMVWLPVLVLAIGLLFLIREFRVSRELIRVQRLGWASTISLTGLVSATVDPLAITKSLRLWGNGGMFCFAGIFTNKRLGRFRLFGTDPKRAVVLRFPDRTVVVTPDRPEAFAEEIRERRGLEDA